MRWAGTVFSLVLLAYVLSRQGWSEVLAALQLIPGVFFVFAVVLIGVSRLAVAARWHLLLRAAGLPIPVRQSARITFAGLFASNFLPTTVGGDVVRFAMSSRLGYDRVICAASVIVDRLVGMAGMATALPFALVPVWGFLVGQSPDPSRGYLLATLSWPERLLGRGRRIVQRLAEATSLWVRSPRGLVAALGITWVHQLSLYTIIWLLFFGMGESIAPWSLAGLWSFTYFVTLLPISINGLGVQELSMTVIFSQLSGVDVGHAAAVALLVRTLQMTASLPGVIFLPDIVSKD